MTFCTHCGTQIEPNASFCSTCGCILNKTETTVSSAQKSKKKSKKGLIFALIGVCVAVLFAVILFFCLGDSADPKRATPEAAIKSYCTAIFQAEVARDANVIECCIPKTLQEKYPEETEECITKSIKHLHDYPELSKEFGKNSTVTVEMTEFEPWSSDELFDFNACLGISGLLATEGGTARFRYTVIGTKKMDTDSDRLDMVKIDGEWYPADNELLEEFLYILEDNGERE